MAQGIAKSQVNVLINPLTFSAMKRIRQPWQHRNTSRQPYHRSTYRTTKQQINTITNNINISMYGPHARFQHTIQNPLEHFQTLIRDGPHPTPWSISEYVTEMLA